VESEIIRLLQEMRKNEPVAYSNRLAQLYKLVQFTETRRGYFDLEETHARG
jgi:hypothetical protein